MNKNFKFYLRVWIVLFVLYTMIAFVSPGELVGFNKFGGAFWAGYAGIALAFIGQLVASFIALKEEKTEKLFYNISMVRISYTGLILTIIVGVLCMAVPDLPNWVGVIACFVVLAFYAVAVIKAKTAADRVSEIDEKVKTETDFIRTMTADAEALMKKVQGEKEKAECKKVYEAIRFSNPRSYPQTEDVEKKMEEQFRLFESVVKTADLEKAQALSSELMELAEERNQKCRLGMRG